MSPFFVLRIDHVVLRVVDLGRAVRFYEDVLGCRVVKEREDLGLVHLQAGSSLIDLVSVGGKLGRVGGAPAGAEGRNVDHLCLRVEPFDEGAWLAHLRRHGVEPHGPVACNFGAEGVGPSLYFSDPEGNTIELKGPSAAPRGDP